MGCSEVSGSSFSLHADRCRSKPLRAKPGPVASNSTFSLCCEHPAHVGYMLRKNFTVHIPDKFFAPLQAEA